MEPSCGTCRHLLQPCCQFRGQAAPEAQCLQLPLQVRTSSTLSRARMWSRVSSVGESPPCKQKICTGIIAQP